MYEILSALFGSTSRQSEIRTFARWLVFNCRSARINMHLLAQNIRGKVVDILMKE